MFTDKTFIQNKKKEKEGQKEGGVEGNYYLRIVSMNCI